jgi:hypothetical protein
MKVEHGFDGKPVDWPLPAAPGDTLATLKLARRRCQRDWPDICPVVALWLSAEILLGEPYRLLEGALPSPWTSIPGYSDYHGTNRTDIVSLFDRAIERARVL